MGFGGNKGMFRQEALQHRNSVCKAKAILLTSIVLSFSVLTMLIIFSSYTRRVNVHEGLITYPDQIDSQIIFKGRTAD